MKAMFVLSVLVLVMSTASARFWQVGDNGLVRWDYNCDYWGNDIAASPSLGEQCGGVCYANPSCTHFTHRDGTCYLKSYYSAGWYEVGSTGATCGWIPGRAYDKRK